MPPETFTVLFRKEDETHDALLRRLGDTAGEVLLIVPAADGRALTPDQRRALLERSRTLRDRLRVATRHSGLASALRREGIRVYERTRDVRALLAGHPHQSEALRAFSPSLWRAQWRSRLQRMGLLALPRLRIWILIVLSIVLFLFVGLRLLPSAEVRVWARRDTVSETANVYLVQSGAVLPVPDAPNVLPLVPLTVQVTKTVLFTDISKQFTGTNAEILMDIFNKSDRDIAIRQGSRLTNQAGMIFRTLEGVSVPMGSHATVRARADSQDLYGDLIGERGNVPEGLRWEFPALSADDRRLIYAQNVTPGKGGRTSSRAMLTAKNIETARDRLLKPELLQEARSLVQQRIDLLTQASGDQWQFFDKSDVIAQTFSGFVLPTDLVGKPVASAPLTGTLTYTVYAYDASAIVSLLKRERFMDRAADQRILEESLQPSQLRVYVIAFDDDFSWIKVTADLAALQEFLLDPLTPSGAKFARSVREGIAGKSIQDALRIVRNLPQVDRVEIVVWPPWGNSLPSIPAHISVVPQ